MSYQVRHHSASLQLSVDAILKGPRLKPVANRANGTRDPDITKLQSYFAELQSFISQVQPFTCLLSKQPKDDSIQSDISKLQSNVTDLLTYVTIVFTTKSLVQPNEPVQYLWRT